MPKRVRPLAIRLLEAREMVEKLELQTKIRELKAKFSKKRKPRR